MGSVKNIAVISDYLPRRCGIATFTTDLCESLMRDLPAGGGPLVQLDPLTGEIVARYGDGIELGLAADCGHTDAVSIRADSFDNILE
jgi:hypothetical protein